MQRINPRIFGASLIGIALVLCAVVVNGYRGPRTPDPRVEAVIAPAPEREYIKVTDADDDGSADWKETLPPKSAWLEESEKAAMATGTDTHTKAVAIDLLTRMMESNMAEGFSASPEMIALESQADIAKLATDELFDESDIIVSDHVSEAALRAYGNRIAEISAEHAVEKEVKNEIDILQAALEAQDPALLADLSLLSASYAGMVVSLQETAAPRGYEKEHLDLLNTLNAMAIDLDAMRQAYSDPLYALVRIRRYEEDVAGLYAAISNVYLKLHYAGIEWRDGDAAADLIRIEE